MTIALVRSATADPTAEEIAAQGAEGRFPGYYVDMLSEASVPIITELADIVGDAELARNLCRQAMRSLQEQLDRVCVRTLITVFQAAREADPSLSYEAFDQRLRLRQAREDIGAQFPELDRLTSLATRRWQDDLRYVVEAAMLDAEHLRPLGVRGLPCGVTLGCGDRHRGGRGVAMVDFTCGTRAVLKPDSSPVAAFVARFLWETDPDQAFFGTVLPRSVTIGNHEWHEFVGSQPVATGASEHTWMRRAGRVAALMFAIGATDLHCENVVARACGPMIVDTETLTSLPPHDSEPASTVFSALRHDLETGPLRTMIFPTRFLGAPIDVDLSGLGGPWQGPAGSSAIRVLSVLHAGTAQIRFEMTTSTLPATGNDIISESGERIDPRRHRHHIVGGYQEGIRWLRRHDADLQNALANRAPGHFRQVVRPTWIYARILDASTHPARLTSTADRRQALSALSIRHPSLRPALSQAVRTAEIDALVNLDIPLFSVDRTGEIRGDLDSLPLGDVGIDPATCVRWWWKHVLGRSEAIDAHAIELSLDTASDDVYNDLDVPGCRDPLTESWDPTSPVWSADRTTATWLTSLLLGEGMKLGPAPISLCEGGGSLLAMVHGSPPESRHDVHQFAKACLRGAVWHAVPEDPHLPEIFISPFTGALSDSTTIMEMARSGVRVDDALISQAEDSFASAAASASSRLSQWSPGQPADYLNGLSGCLVALARYRDHLPAQSFDHLTDGAAQIALQAEAYLVGDRTAGLAHGTLGRLLALSSLSTLVDVKKLNDAVEQGLRSLLRTRKRDAALLDRGGRTAWCRGHAGMVLGLLPVLKRLDIVGSERQSILSWHLDTLLGADLGDRNDVSLCHGAAGPVLALALASNALADPGLHDHALAQRDRFLELVELHGYRSGLGRAPGAESFLMGRPGWDLALASLRDINAVPRILGVDL